MEQDKEKRKPEGAEEPEQTGSKAPAETEQDELAKLGKSELKKLVVKAQAEAEAARAEAETARAECEVAKKVALQAAEFQTLYTRLKADFDNYKRRNAGIAEKSLEDATVSLAEKLLPVLDNFGRAIAAVKDENVLVGIRMIEQQLYDVLEHIHVKKFESLGKDFDHNFHDAVLMQDAPKEQAGKVLHVVQEGYLYNDRVIRAAKVIVGKEADEE